MRRLCVCLGECPAGGGEVPPRGRVLWHVGPDTEGPAVVEKTPQFYRFPILGEVDMAKTMTSSQQTILRPKFLDKKGNPGAVDGAPVWFVDNPNVLAITPSPDGLTCSVLAVGPVGVATVSMTADADLGEGVTSIAGVLAFEIVAGAVVSIELDADEPTEQP